MYRRLPSDDKASVVIPTMQKSPRLSHLLQRLEGHPLVGEILIVNNSDRPLDAEVKHDSFTKLQVIYEGPNLMVNPAWNAGAAHARFPKLAICNDDLTISDAFLTAVISKVGPKVGIVGPAASAFRIGRDTGRGFFLPADRATWGFGTFMALRTESYVEIPESMKIWSGDDFLFDVQRERNYWMFGLRLHTEMSTTSANLEFDQQKQDDLQAYLGHYASGSPYIQRFGPEVRLRRLARNTAKAVVPRRHHPKSWTW